MCLKPISIKKIFLLSMLLFVAQMGFAQRYDGIVFRIDSFANVGLPKSALAEVEKLDKQARRNRNLPMQIKAVIYRMTFQSYVEENALPAIIDSLKADIKVANFPANAVLRSMLANMYYQYYEQNRWRFAERTQVLNPGSDYTQWDLRTIIDETTRLYQLSLSEAGKLQATPVDVLDGVLTGDKSLRYLRPTLYDLLAQRAQGFYLGDEPALSKPKTPFSINNSVFFGSADAFIKLPITTADTLSTWYRGLKLLQQAIAFHLQRGDTEAEADLDLQRLNFFYGHATLDDKDKLYLQGLQQIANSVADKPISTQALTAIGTYYKAKDSLVLAMRYLKQAAAKFADSKGHKNALMLIRDLQTKVTSAQVEQDNVPGKPLLFAIKYRNVSQVNYSVYNLTKADIADLAVAPQNYRNAAEMAKKLLTVVKAKQPVQQNQIALKADTDYKEHITEYKIAPLTMGRYVLAVKESGAVDSLTQLVEFNVTQLSAIIRQNPNDDVDLKVLNRETGAPMPGVAVTLYSKRSWYDRAKQRNIQIDTTYLGVTDKTGTFIARQAKNGQYSADLKYKDDFFSYGSVNVSGETFDEEDEEESEDDKTVLFTDRQIYRPGQTIYFKGIQLEIFKYKTRIVPGKKIDVDLMDGNNKSVSKITFTTNEFGTFAGQFVIPQNVLSGTFTLDADDGEIEIKIEEYKRPTFKAELTPVTQTYKFNDSVTVKGKVTAFSGYGLSNAKVAYHVKRRLETSFYYDYSARNTNDAEIKADTIVTDSKGAFEIKFKAIPAEVSNKTLAVFEYSITADVTDAAGETRSTTGNVRVGYENLVLNSIIPPMLLAKNADKVAITLKNLNGQLQNGTLKMQIYKVGSPPIIFKKRLWQSQPDRFLLAAADYHSYFPGYAFNKEDDKKNWPVASFVIDNTIKVDTGSTAYIDLKPLAKQAPGVYKITINAQNSNGDTTSASTYVNTVAEKAIPTNITDWVLPMVTEVEPGRPAGFLVGFDKPIHVLMEKYSGPRLVKSEWLYLDGGMHNIKVEMSKSDTNIAVQFTMVHQNRVYNYYKPITSLLLSQGIDMKLLSFKNKLQPGEKDRWKLQLSAGKNEKLAAEMVAGMYDASLDDVVQPKAWQLDARPFNEYRNQRYFTWDGLYGFVQASTTEPLFFKDDNDYTFLTNIYEQLNLYGYNYYGGGNYAYRNYLNQIKRAGNTINHDRILEDSYRAIAAKVKNGYEISGKVIDARDRSNLMAVTVSIEGLGLAVVTNSEGYFRIRVPKDATLKVSFIGYKNFEYKVSKTEQLIFELKPDEKALQEVVVVGYGTQKRMSITGAVSMVSAPTFALAGKVAGINVNNRVNGRELVGIYGHSAPGDLPAELMEKMQMVNDFGNQASKKPIALRTNFAETAFFYPQLRTDDKGKILIDFTVPESLTKWRFKAFAHTKNLQTGYLEQEVITQKQLSISATTPRFLREGDTITVSARLANLSTTQQKGKIELQLFNALNMQPVKLLLNAADARQDFDIATATTKAVSFKMVIPAGLDAVTYRLTADAGSYSDGEENTLPVLPNRMLVTESMPMMLRGGHQRTFTFDKLVNQSSTTLKNKTLTLEYTQNPAWYAVQALPYMMEFPYECSEQIFSRYYANSLGTDLVNKMPVIKSVFERWKATNSTQLISNLEKNQELKSVLLEETPWLRDAANETEQKQRIALLFDLNRMNYELDANLDKLTQKQLPGGGFPWFAGDHADRFITQHVIAGIGQLYSLGVADSRNTKLKAIADKAIAYLDNEMLNDERERKRNNRPAPKYIYATDIHAWYARSYFDKPTNAEVKTLLNTYLNLAAKEWVGHSIYEQGLIALTMQRNGRGEVARAIIKSLKETAKQKDDMGMYWANNRPGWYWYEAPIETQSLMIELFTLIPGNEKEVEEMKIWLLRNKQTSNWKTTKATAAAVYALLLKGSDLLNDNAASTIKLNNTDLQTLKPDTKAEAGTGYLKTSWADDAVKPAFGNVSIANNSKAISWGALHWQYLENLDKITPSTTDITLERKYFIQQQGNAGSVLQVVDANHAPKVGDVLKVVVYLKAGRDMEYIHLKDMRPAGTEPVDVLSTYKYQDGLYYYQVTKDVATNFFISQMKKGNYVFEYSLRVAQPGNFSTGISTVQCMYAPEFNAHSEGGRLLVK